MIFNLIHLKLYSPMKTSDLLNQKTHLDINALIKHLFLQRCSSFAFFSQFEPGHSGRAQAEAQSAPICFVEERIKKPLAQKVIQVVNGIGLGRVQADEAYT